MRYRALIIALLLISLLAPMAGAIFLEGADIPDNYDPYLLAASSGLAPGTDSGGPNDGLYTPAYDPGPIGEMPLQPTAAPDAISAQKVIATSAPSYVVSPPSVPAIRSFATATNTGTETVMPPDYSAPANSSKFNPSANGLLHLEAASRGYDVSKIGGIALPRAPACIAIPAFTFPALFR